MKASENPGHNAQLLFQNDTKYSNFTQIYLKQCKILGFRKQKDESEKL